MIINDIYMRRALQIARHGFPFAMPNPMVGAVIVDSGGKIIGEGFHRKCGEAHAEVNAINSVADINALIDSTMYVTLEPCAHYGRTGPCAKLIIDKKIPRVVVGCRDPFEKVDGKGIDMLKEAGVEVSVGVMEKECRQLNAIFFTAHTLHRPFIILKWAQSADGYMDIVRHGEDVPAKISSCLTSVLMHRFRAACDGIIVGSNTILEDNPKLDTRLWPGDSPRPIVFDRRGRICDSANVMKRNPIIISSDESLPEIMDDLYERGFTSVLVEGGAQMLRSFIEQGLWDLARVETGTFAFGENGRVKAPCIPIYDAVITQYIDSRTICYYSKNELIDVKNL